jgi:hypothetical protein
MSSEEAEADDARQGAPTEELVIEASWAPQDPRDRLYDKDASAQERSASLFRIIAAFHPVLNLPVVLFDLAKRVGPIWFFSGVTLAVAALVTFLYG